VQDASGNFFSYFCVSMKSEEKLSVMRANIVQIGRVVNRNPVNWSFDSYTNIPALSISGKGILYYGYTIEELESISTGKF
jgi:hypothetical protein